MMLRVFCFCIFFAITQSLPTVTRKLVFVDYFSGQALDTEKWLYQTGHKHYDKLQLMCYMKKNVVVNNGLTITAKVNGVNCDDGFRNFTSGRIKTRKEFQFTKIEVRAKLTNGKGIHPGIWTQKSDTKLYEEMDLVELKGNYVKQLHSAVHWGNKKVKLNKITKTYLTHDLSKNFHTYGLERTDDYLIYYLDDFEYFRVNRNNVTLSNEKLFSQPGHVIFSLAVGGRWFKHPVTPEEAKKWKEPTMEIKFVKIYE